MIIIDSGYFYAGAVICNKFDGFIERSAPIIKYMEGWHI